MSLILELGAWRLPFLPRCINIDDASPFSSPTTSFPPITSTISFNYPSSSPMPPQWTYEHQLQFLKQYIETFRSIPTPSEFWLIVKLSWEQQQQVSTVAALEEEQVMKEVCGLPETL